MSKTITCRYDLLSCTEARLNVFDNDYSGRPDFQNATFERLGRELPGTGDYGKILFDMLFPYGGPLHEGYIDCLEAARTSKVNIRFRLRLAEGLPEEIRSLEWESIVDCQGPIALATAKFFSRCAFRPTARLNERRPRLLVAIAAPLDARTHYRLEEIDHAGIRDALEREVLEPLSENGLLDYDFIGKRVTVERLQRHVESSRFDLLHLVAHGVAGFDMPSALVLENDNGLAHPIAEDTVSSIFQGNHALRLVTLVACDSAKPSNGGSASGLAGILVRDGIPAVVAMQGRISIDAATRFSQSLYRSLLPEGKIDAAVNHARRRLSISFAGSSEWRTPVLFMRPPDGRLWPYEDSEAVTMPVLGQKKPGAKPSRSRSFPGRLEVVVTLILMVSALGLGWVYRSFQDIQRPPESRFGNGVLSLSSEALRKLREADSLVETGGDSRFKRSVQIYLDVLEEIPDDYLLSRADDLVLKRAREANSKEYYDDAARLFNTFFDRIESGLPSDIVVEVTNPLGDGLEVQTAMSVQGRATLPEGYHLWVFARRDDFSGIWWPQDEGRIDGGTGEWRVTASFGREPDIGRNFDVAVAVFDMDAHQELRNWLIQARKKGSFEPIPMPKTAAQPQFFTVRKVGHD